MTQEHRRRGAPLAALVAIIAVWIGVRAALWETPLLPRLPELSLASGLPAASDRDRSGGTELAPRAGSVVAGGGLALLAVSADSSLHRRASANALPGSGLAEIAGSLPVSGLTALSLPSEAEGSTRSALPPLPGLRAKASNSRWSADGWLLYRSGGGRAGAGVAVLPSYGASQAGAVVRYRLSDATTSSPALYLRATSSLEGRTERELAAGLAGRPLAAVPLLAMAELRVFDTGARTEVRPAVLLVSDLAPRPFGKVGEAAGYVQAGYVGGRFATPFVDGQLRLTREIARAQGIAAEVGVGTWGGAQRGASRLDVGPTAAVEVPVGKADVRLAIDYRIRVTGDARPGSGPAVTLSTGF